MNYFLNGVGVALITPFNENGSIDFESLIKVVNFNIDNGVDYLVALGTTAETATLTNEQKHEVLECVISANKGRKKVIVGIGGNSTAEVCSQISELSYEGVSAILSVTPYYNKPTQEGLYQHYKAVSNASKLPIILYNVPGRTGVNMTATTTLRLAHEFDNIVAIKDASGDFGQAAYILRNRPEGFKFLSGDDNIAVALISQGGDGVISVAANAFPLKFSQMIHNALDGDFKGAQKGLYELLEVTDLLFAEGNPAGVKAALASKGIIKNFLRLPLVSSSEELYNKIENQIKKYNL